jgi:hypothetical protein
MIDGRLGRRLDDSPRRVRGGGFLHLLKAVFLQMRRGQPAPVTVKGRYA